MQINYVVLAIPVFFLLIGVELVAARLLERDVYRLADSLADLGCGILQQLLDVFMKTALFAGYAWVYAHARLASLPAKSVPVWIACFLGVDLLYYWFHRMSHETNAFWAAHVVHHQSEEYNLSVALRQGAVQGWFAWVFYLPLAFLGFPPLVFLTLSSFNTLYQFWIHTRLIGRLGALEWVLNTPSNHRVHHARNPKYIDRNHGGTLIVWDRLFGTYVAEQEEPVYGVTTPLRSFNPVWANLHYWRELWRKARRASRRADRLRLLWERPGWRPAELGGFEAPPEVDRASAVPFAPSAPPAVAAYAFVQFLPALAGASFLLFEQERLGRAALAGGALAVALSLVAVGALFEGRAWAAWLETGRLALLASAAFGLGLLPATPSALLTACALVTAGAALLLWQRPAAARRPSER